MTFDGLGVLIFSGTINFACLCVVVVVVGGDRVGRSCRRHSYYLVEPCFTFSLCESESLKFISPPPIFVCRFWKHFCWEKNWNKTIFWSTEAQMHRWVPFWKCAFGLLIQICQASRIWRESLAFYLYFTHKFTIHFFISSHVFVSVANHTFL